MKPLGVESVPTVDQWMSDLGLEEMLEAVFDDVLRKQLYIAFPHSNQVSFAGSVRVREGHGGWRERAGVLLLREGKLDYHT